MAEEGGNNQNQSAGLSLLFMGLVVIIVAIVSLAIGLGAGGGGSGGANPMGASAARPIDPIDPQDMILLDSLVQGSRPEVRITKLIQSLPRLKTNLDLLAEHLQKDSSPLSLAQKTRIQSLYQRVKTAISRIETISPTGEETKTLAFFIGKDIQDIKLTIYDTSGVKGVARRDKVIELAKKFADENADWTPVNNKYPYVDGGDGPDKFDCSGFITYLVKQFGIIDKEAPRLSTGSADSWPNFTKITHDLTPATVSKEALVKLAEQGILLPGDVLVLQGNIGHAVLYVGLPTGDKNVIAASGKKSGGPQYRNLEQVARRFKSGNEINILRPNY